MSAKARGFSPDNRCCESRYEFWKWRAGPNPVHFCNLAVLDAKRFFELSTDDLLIRPLFRKEVATGGQNVLR